MQVATYYVNRYKPTTKQPEHNTKQNNITPRQIAKASHYDTPHVHLWPARAPQDR